MVASLHFGVEKPTYVSNGGKMSPKHTTPSPGLASAGAGLPAPRPAPGPAAPGPGSAPAVELPSKPAETGTILWTDAILHHFATMGNHCLLVFAGETSFQGVLAGAAFRPSTVGVLLEEIDGFPEDD